MEAPYWLITSTPGNFAVTADLGYARQGFKRRHHRTVAQVAPGHGLVYYLTGEQTLAGILGVTSHLFEDDSPCWRAVTDANERYPWRVKTEPVIVPPPEARVPAAALAPRLEFVRKWPARHWHLAFQGQIRRISEHDFNLIRSALQEQVQR